MTSNHPPNTFEFKHLKVLEGIAIELEGGELSHSILCKIGRESILVIATVPGLDVIGKSIEEDKSNQNSLRITF